LKIEENIGVISPLNSACRNDNEKLVKYLIEQGEILIKEIIIIAHH